MIIKIERSGGVTGIPISNEIDVKDLPSGLVNTAKKILVDEKFPSLSMKRPSKGSADYFSYKISVQNGANQRTIECDEHNIQDDLKQIVKYIERNSEKIK